MISAYKYTYGTKPKRIKTRTNMTRYNIEAIRNGEKKNLNWADLVGADLREANLSGANLRNADLREANLSGANLKGADLKWANLREANLSGADLRDAHLKRAGLRWANLNWADLKRADLREVNLSGANLKEADLNWADLREANLREADLRDAHLKRADLSGANLNWADLREAQLPIFERIPQDGSFIAYKTCKDHVVKIEIPKTAESTSSLIGPKCRAEYVKTIEVLDKNGEPCSDAEAISKYDKKTKYREGEITKPDNWDDDIRVECTNGIHFFPTKREAIEFGNW